ncbi:MAG: sialate O-acetylesterase, partial [Chitinophagaceae bacterium]
MKSIVVVCLLSISLLSAAQPITVDSNFHVYLLIGQSNMAGRGIVDSQSKIATTQILILDSQNRWVAATDPVHYDKPASVGVGPAIDFAKEISGNNKSVKIGLIPCALGGSPIKVWEPNAVYLKAFRPYDDAIERARIAETKGVLKGILWHQGESDNDSLRAAVYLEKLSTLIRRLRAELKQPNLPFVAGEIGYFNKSNFINPVINQLPEKVAFTAVVSAKGLTHKGDRLHFDTPSARELGKRYARKMKALQELSKTASNQTTETKPIV